MVSRNYSSVAQPTTLTGNISSGAVSVGVNSPTGFPAPPFTAALDYGSATEELVEVTAASLGTWTVTRAIDGTSAQSHSIGAVARHVTSARDSADSRTHEAATTAVHGVAGTLVGTSDTQTLANKTLTSPTINAGALSGTFTGSPTFSGAPVLSAGGALSGTFTGSPTLSGNPTFSGAPVFTGGLSLTGNSLLIERALATDSTFRARVTADTNSRWVAEASGKQTWGTGAATGDTNLYRGAVGVLKTDSALTVAPSGANGMMLVNATSGAFTGKLADFQLAGVSKASIDQGGNLVAGNFTDAAWATWTPTWSTTTGSHLPSFGNAVIVGTYAKFGRMLVFSLAVTFGSTTNFGGGATFNDNWTFSMPGGFTASSRFAGGTLLCGMGRAAQDGNRTSPIAVRVDTGGTTLIMDTAGGRQDGIALDQAGALDAVTPWVWASANVIQFSGTVETTV